MQRRVKSMVGIHMAELSVWQPTAIRTVLCWHRDWIESNYMKSGFKALQPLQRAHTSRFQWPPCRNGEIWDGLQWLPWFGDPDRKSQATLPAFSSQCNATVCQEPAATELSIYIKFSLLLPSFIALFMLLRSDSSNYSWQDAPWRSVLRAQLSSDPFTCTSWGELQSSLASWFLPCQSCTDLVPLFSFPLVLLSSFIQLCVVSPIVSMVTTSASVALLSLATQRF